MEGSVLIMNNACSRPEIYALLIPYIDGELDEEERRRIEEHLVECEICARELKELSEADILLLKYFAKLQRNCLTEDRLVALQSGKIELTQEEKEHIDVCPSCSSSLDLLNELDEYLEEEPIRMPESLLNIVRREYPPQLNQSRRNRLSSFFSSVGKFLVPPRGYRVSMATVSSIFVVIIAVLAMLLVTNFTLQREYREATQVEGISHDGKVLDVKRDEGKIVTNITDDIKPGMKIELHKWERKSVGTGEVVSVDEENKVSEFKLDSMEEGIEIKTGDMILIRFEGSVKP